MATIGNSAKWHTLAELNAEATDPWRTRFKASAEVILPNNVHSTVGDEMRWVDLHEYLGSNNDNFWFTSWQSIEKDNSLDPSKIQNPLCATIQGVALTFAQAPNSPTNYEWWRAYNNNATSLELDDPNLSINIIGAGNAVDLRATMFNCNDYRAVTASFATISEPVINGMPRFAGAFPSSPFIEDATHGVNTFSARQRVKLWNAPDFLLLPGTMVISTDRRRIYFIPPTTTQISDFAGEEAVLVGQGKPAPIDGGNMLEVSIPFKNGNEIFESPISFHGPDSTVTNGTANDNNITTPIEVEGVVFSTGAGDGVQIENWTNATIKNCVFRNYGYRGLRLIHAKTVNVGATGETNAVTFREGYRGFVQTRYWRDQSATVGDNQDLIFSALTFLDTAMKSTFARQDTNKQNITFNNCKFQRGGLLYPASAGIFMDGYSNAVTVTASSFFDIPGPAIWYRGTNHVISNNLITDCMKGCTEIGAVYAGRSWVQIGNLISGNTFTNIYNRDPEATPTLDLGATYLGVAGVKRKRVANSLDDFVVAIMWDDLMSGQTARNNTITNCEIGILNNGGHHNYLDSNIYNSVNYPWFIQEFGAKTLPSDGEAEATKVNASSLGKCYYEMDTLVNHPSLPVILQLYNNTPNGLWYSTATAESFAFDLNTPKWPNYMDYWTRKDGLFTSHTSMGVNSYMYTWINLGYFKQRWHLTNGTWVDTDPQGSWDFKYILFKNNRNWFRYDSSAGAQFQGNDFLGNPVVAPTTSQLNFYDTQLGWKRRTP